MKRILGLDLGTNSIGWSLIEQDFNKKEGQILGMGTRIIPMSQDILGKFDSGNSISQTAERTSYRGMRRLNERYLLRRQRLHRVLNILGFLPDHYAASIDFHNKLGQFLPGKEVKLNYILNGGSKHHFIFQNSFDEMAKDFKIKHPDLKIPYDWTLYYLRKKALKDKISKEELAWLILNFNQKRGYYQLRGEEEEIEKNQEYVSLTVKELINTGEAVKGKPLYKVIFKNGWEYDREITKIEDWEKQEREFIVTTKTNKDGSLKRTFKKVDSEQDWIAIKKKTEQNIDETNKTVGEFIYETLLKKPSQKIRGNLVKTIDRKYYKNELIKILEVQKEFHPELENKDLYKKCLNELYPRNEAHQSNIKEKDFTYLFVEDIIFYQRPLKTKKSTISNCAYEKRYFQKDGEIQEQPLKGIPKSNPFYQEFRLWQFIQNLRIYKKIALDKQKAKIDEDITNHLLPDTKSIVELFDFLNNRKEIDQNQLLKYFSDLKLIPKQKKDAPSYRWNYVEDKKYPCNTTRAEFLTRLKKLKGIQENFFDKKTENDLWHIVYSVKDKKDFEKALGTFARKKRISESKFVENFKKIAPYSNDYGAYSEKAIKKLLPLMRMGKYWNEESLKPEIKNRIEDIQERLRAINFNKDEIETVADDAYKKQVLKSFLKSENKKNPFEGLNTYQACYAVYERHSEVSEIINWQSPSDIEFYLNETFKQHQLKNPIVEQVVTETLRVVRDIWKYYGNSKADFFSEIHVELGREMKNSAEKRQRLSNQNNERENTNLRIKAVLEELQDEGVEEVKPYSPNQQEILKLYEEGVYFNAKYDQVSEDEIEAIRKKNSPTKKDILRYKLWLEQGYRSPYTGNIIPMSKLFTTDYQIEHIIPQSRFFDDSFNNKVICESAINPYPYKDNQTAYEFINNSRGCVVPELGINGKECTIFTVEEYEAHCKSYYSKNRTKLKYLLSEDIPEGFINRQLNDSRYISKFIKGLLSNILREPNEREATVKNLVPVNGAITSQLKQDWGLNDKWNEIIAPRFKRMNEITKSNDYGYWDNKINAFRTQVPKDIETGFSKKRIDHRHHALDALVIACTTKDHINYITSINTERKNHSLVKKLRKTKDIELGGKKRTVAKSYKQPWEGFTIDAKNALEEIVISFKKNIRVINRTNNKTWHWEKKNGQWKKALKFQKGNNFAIRKPLHKETVSGLIDIPTPKGKVATATRTNISDIKNHKHIDKITDKSIQKILRNHVKNYLDQNGKEDFAEAFSPKGITDLNQNIKELNSGKNHQPIYKVRQYEVGNKFSVGERGNKTDKYVEAAKGTNLFFAVYWDDKKKKRNFETIPLNEVLEHQKQMAHIPMKDKEPIPIDHTKGKFLFFLSPNDLVYIPDREDIDSDVIPENLKKEKIYKMVSSTGIQCFFIKHQVSTVIQNKVEYSALNKMEKDIEDNMIKNICWKLEIDRLGNIKKIVK
ncbi:type II CRISPR RNA-guided endonuclease Cas9 [Salegentibacter sp. Hel_I_6]|uniref:type II CRISPR RNA-guided endonuclease Cas9 n=1 Tax=Salegentibacter sp. Hel_I_6 TaxID=1250278 RepID=UPI000565C344|nr:type II CRISPR RNA-guided endonuclease Cas9 [Salegentibacter sp. Hel_I_6]